MQLGGRLSGHHPIGFPGLCCPGTPCKLQSALLGHTDSPEPGQGPAVPWVRPGAARMDPVLRTSPGGRSPRPHVQGHGKALSQPPQGRSLPISTSPQRREPVLGHKARERLVWTPEPVLRAARFTAKSCSSRDNGWDRSVF